MLNTESRMAACAVWCSIAVILSTALWSLMDGPSPAEILGPIGLSSLPLFLSYYQTLIGLMIGFFVLSFVLARNGRLERQERSRTREQSRQYLRDALILEITDLGAYCENKAVETYLLSDNLNERTFPPREDEAFNQDEHLYKLAGIIKETLLMTATPQDLFALGSQGYRTLHHLRQQIKGLSSKIKLEPLSSSNPQQSMDYFSALSRSYISLSWVCSQISEIFENPAEYEGKSTDKISFPGAATENELDALLSDAMHIKKDLMTAAPLSPTFVDAAE